MAAYLEQSVAKFNIRNTVCSTESLSAEFAGLKDISKDHSQNSGGNKVEEIVSDSNVNNLVTSDSERK